MADKEQSEQNKAAEHENTSPKTEKASKKSNAGSKPPKQASPSEVGGMRIPGAIEIGQVTTVGQAMDWKPGDPPFQVQKRLEQPTIEEIHKYCMDTLEAHEKEEQEKKMFGPERPPEMEKK